jgi:hypothetical protein
MASQTINARSEIDTSKMRIDPHSAMSDTHVPTYCLPEFGKDGVVKGELKDGYFVPAGAMLPRESKHDSRVALLLSLAHGLEAEASCAFLLICCSGRRDTSGDDLEIWRVLSSWNCFS